MRIIEFGTRRFGLNAAKAYFQKLESRFRDIAENHEQFPKVEHIRPGYRRSVCGAHSIYFRMSEQSVEIIRILGRQSFNDPG